jgi:hypothetical protein
MTWVEQFKTDNSRLISEHGKLSKAAAGHEKRLANFISEIQRLKDHREALLAEQVSVVAGESDLSSLKFDKDRRDTEATIAVREVDRMCLQQEVMPRTEEALVQTRNKLRMALIAEADSRNRELEIALLAEFEALLCRYADFVGEAEALFAESGIKFNPYETRLPIDWRSRMRVFAGDAFNEEMSRLVASRRQAAAAPAAPESEAVSPAMPCWMGPKPKRARTLLRKQFDPTPAVQSGEDSASDDGSGPIAEELAIDDPLNTATANDVNEPAVDDEPANASADEGPAVDDLLAATTSNSIGDSLPVLDESAPEAENLP